MFKVDNKDNRPPFDNVILVYYLALVLLLSTLNMNTSEGLICIKKY